MSTHDNQGRAYAKLNELKLGDTVSVDGDFTCLEPWSQHKVCLTTSGGRPFIRCRDGRHMLAGQADDGIHCVGVYPGVVTDPGPSTIKRASNVVGFKP